MVWEVAIYTPKPNFLPPNTHSTIETRETSRREKKEIEEESTPRLKSRRKKIWPRV